LVWLFLTLIFLITIDIVIHCVYVRLILRVFETKPPFSVPSFPPDPTAEQISFVTDDGLILRGSIHRQIRQPPKGLILFCPELEGNHWSAPSYAGSLLDSGFDIIAFDFRGQGESDPQPGYAPLHWPTTFELKDVRAVLRYIQSRDDLNNLPLGVMGVSRGSTPALIAAAESSRIKAVCCEGAYSTDALMTHFVSRWAALYVPQFVLPYLPTWHIRMTIILVRWTSQVIHKRNYIVLEKWLPKLKNQSVLFVAGGRDNYVHPDVGRELQKQIDSPNVQFWLVPTAKHNRARTVEPIEYDRRLRDFFDKTLGVEAV